MTASAPLRVAERLFDPSRPGAEIVETHVSVVVFDGDRVHKRKKPVRLPFVDLSTPERREEVCHREVELNRRFCPDVYLGVEDVVDEAGNVVDHAVLMRRMPAERRLATLARGHVRDVASCVRAVARQVAASHAAAETSDEISAVASPEALGDLWQANLSELSAFTPHPLDPQPLAEIGELAHRYLDGRGALLADRIECGRVVDGHGDLLADDIFCLDDGPRILDGLEFDDRLRWGDVLYDVGFLAMDLERLGRLDLADRFLDWYQEFSGETHPVSLEHHYVGYRALVRAKISCLRGGPADEADARHYLALCRRHLLAGRVQLVLVGGLPGTGKTTLARAVGDELGWPVLRSDEIRKELAGLDPRQPAPAAYGEGLYSPAMTDATYAEMFDRARTSLAGGESVVLDASFAASGRRSAAADLARAALADLTELRCVLPAEVAAERLRRRAAAGGDASDASAAVAARMAEDFDPWPTSVNVGTVPPVEDVLPGVLERLAAPRRRARSAPGGRRPCDR